MTSETEGTPCVIDTMSLHSLSLALRQCSPQESYLMQWKNAVHMTAEFIKATNYRVAHGLSPRGAANGTFEVLVEHLGDFVDFSCAPPPAPTADTKRAFDNTLGWASSPDGLRALRSQLARFEDRSSDFCRWADEAVDFAWIEQVQRLGCLFEDVLVPTITNVLDLEESVVRHAQSKSSAFHIVSLLSRTRRPEPEYILVRRAWVLAALIRGYFHEFLSGFNSVQLRPFEIRKECSRLKSLDAHPLEIHIDDDHRITPVKKLANIVVSSALTESTHDARVKMWADNTLIARRALKNGPSELPNAKLKESWCESKAIDFARAIGLRTYPKYAEHGLELMKAVASFSTGTIATFYQMPPAASLVVGLATATADFALGRMGATEWVARNLANRRARLQHLARLGPGRVEVH